MEFFVNFAEVGVGDMSVNLSGANISMTKHGLNAAKIGAVHEKVGSKRVAQSVGCDVFSYAGGFSIMVDNALDRASGESSKIAASVNSVEMFRVIEKEGRQRIVPNSKIIASGVSGGFANEDGAIFFTFAANDKFTTVKVDAVAIKADKFGNAETARKEKLDDGTIPKTRFVVVGYGV